MCKQNSYWVTIPVPAEESVLLQLEAQMQQPSCKTAVEKEKKRLLLIHSLNKLVI